MTTTSTVTSTAAASLSSPGIGSGLDVNGIVQKLVAVESQPLTDLQNAASKIQTSISTYGQLQSLVSTLQTAAQGLSDPTLWKKTSATSSNASAVSVSTTTGGVAAGNYTVSVSALAQAQNLVSGTYSDATAQVGSGTLAIQIGSWGAGNSFTPKSGSSTVSITIAPGATLADIRDQINAANAGVTAAIVTDTSGARLTIGSSSTGLDNQVRITAADSSGSALAPGSGLGALSYAPDVGAGGLGQTQAAANAQATINGLAVQTDSNTLGNVLNGVTLQLNSVTTNPAVVSVAPDTGSATTAINGFVSAYNALYSFLATQTAYDASTKVAGPLQGDSTAIGLQFSMRTLLMGNGGGSSVFAGLGAIGFSTAKDGTLSVDSTKLTAALSNMPEVGKLFSNTNIGNPSQNGFGQLFNNLASQAIGFNGSISVRTNGLNTELQNNQSDQDRMNARIAQYQARLLAQYNALDTTMAQMTSLSSYVSQQITAMLNSSSSK